MSAAPHPFDVDAIAERLRAAGHGAPAGMFANEAGVAWLLDCSVRTLRTWRANAEGPPCYLAARWLYPLDDLCTWLASRSASELAGENLQIGADPCSDDVAD